MDAPPLVSTFTHPAALTARADIVADGFRAMEPVRAFLLPPHAAVESDTIPQFGEVIVAPPVAVIPPPFFPKAIKQPPEVDDVFVTMAALAMADCDPPSIPASPIPYTREKKSVRGMVTVAV